MQNIFFVGWGGGGGGEGGILGEKKLSHAAVQ